MINNIFEKLNLIIDDGTRLILEKLLSSGFQAYVVGGAVRDALIGEEIHDRDLTTDATPDEILKVFNGYNVILTGVKFNTVTVVVDNVNYEITTFRAEQQYLDGRHPSDVVCVKTLKEDLSRRDFTINAMAFNEEDGLIDLFGGVQDIESKQIRTVGEAKLRFDEDALRVLRALRFASKFGFSIEEKTSEAIFECKSKIKLLSVERVYNELTQILQCKDSSKILKQYKEVLFEIMPEFEPCVGFDQKSLSHSYDVFDHTLVALSIAQDRLLGFNQSDRIIILLSVLFHDVGKPQSFVIGNDGFGHFPSHWERSSEISKRILKRLKAPKTVINEVANLCLHHDNSFKDKYHLKLFLNKFSKQFFLKLLQIKYADVYAHSEYGVNRVMRFYKPMIEYFNEIEKNNECYNVSQLDFNGFDAIDLGVEKEQISTLLNNVLDCVMQGKLENKKEIIIYYVKHNLIKKC